MNRRLIHFLKISCFALGLGVVLCACPAGFAPKGSFSGSGDAASVATSNEGADAEDGSLPLPTFVPSEGPAFNPVIGSAPAGDGTIALPSTIDSPTGTSSNPIVADNSGGITAQPDGSVIGRLPFLPAKRRIGTGFEFGQKVEEGGTVRVTLPPSASTLNLRVFAEYQLANSMLQWHPYPVGTQIRLIYLPKNGNITQIRHYDTVVTETSEGVPSANISVDDLPLPGNGKLIVFTYEAYHHDEESGEYVMHRTDDFQEDALVSFSNVFQFNSFLNDFFSHLLFNVDVRDGFGRPVKGQ